MDVITDVVKATRGITDDLKRHGTRLTEEDSRIKKLKTRLSATANNLITATKNHAASQGVSPVSLVDAAASHLSATVVDLVKLVKLRPGSTASFDDTRSEHSRYSDINTPVTSPGEAVSSYAATKKAIPIALNLASRLPQRVPLEELYPPRSPSTPRSVDSPLSSARVTYPSREEDDLRAYLDNKTQAIVDSIQNLLTRIRNPKLDSMEDFKLQVTEIITIVEQIVGHTTGETQNIERLEGDTRITDVLDSLRGHAVDMKEVLAGPASSADLFKKRLARISFDISKQIKVTSPFAPLIIGTSPYRGKRFPSKQSHRFDLKTLQSYIVDTFVWDTPPTFCLFKRPFRLWDKRGIG
jgi:G protein-coupled receptor kinase-interacting protein 1 C term